MVKVIQIVFDCYNKLVLSLISLYLYLILLLLYVGLKISFLVFDHQRNYNKTQQ